jgi:hypothetical protein
MASEIGMPDPKPGGKKKKNIKKNELFVKQISVPES